MLPEPDVLVDAAAAISDGRAVDWDALVRDADDEELRRHVLGLRRVAEILGAHDAFHEPDRTGEPADRAPHLRPGLVLGARYRVERRLGGGGMGEVWLAFDLKLCVDVALKALRSDRATPRSREGLRREVRAARRVVSPHVCRIFDLVEVDGVELISMEAIDGVDLREYLRRNGPLSLEEAGDVASQLLAGLQTIHDAGLVHRDLKPANVMITPAGRVVVMDFGIASARDETSSGTIAGTPAYMAPEQREGRATDARSDIYAAGLVLLELVDPVRQSPLQEALDDYGGPWRGALSRALATDPSARFTSAIEFGRALEHATLGATEQDDRCPYLGLDSYGEEDARVFYGREADVESLVRKLKRLPMLAVVGPSGVGKTSLLRAGLLPSLPEAWGRVLCAPGDSPFVALGQGLAPRLGGDPDDLALLARIGEPDAAVSLFRRWRRSHDDAVVLVDQFEELFTQCPEEVQREFTTLLGRLTLEADVRVLLSVRDDFLFRCHAFPSLRPILTELTLLPPLAGPELRRALVQPALARGYRFEDDALVTSIVGEVERERGALPLLSFTASRLWEQRDRDRSLLTRAAYRAIGGVGGSLAQHAEETLQRIGPSREPVVREMFRALVTPHGTRLSRDREELLSVAEDRDTAIATLGRLVEGRLLTTYESPDANDPGTPRRRIEIVHESLLSHWPRLVRWQTQDADAAQLRDQLRRAAELWDQRGRPQDLLWAGTVHDDYRLWRRRYRGALTALEEAFGDASTARERHRRRRRRVALGSVIVLLAAGLATTSALWRRSERAHADAVAQARRAEAEKLFTLAQTDGEVPDAFAYTLAALELSDQPAYRRHALKLSLRGPLPFRLPVRPAAHNVHPVEVSPDGRWLAMGWSVGAAVELHPTDGGPPRVLGNHDNQVIATRFTDDSRFLVTTGYDAVAKVWTVPDGALVRTLEVREVTYPFPRDGGRVLLCEFGPGAAPRWREWWPAQGEVRTLGSALAAIDPSAEPGVPDVDPSGRRAVVPRGRDVLLYELDALEKGPVRLLGRHAATVRGVRFSPDGARLASFDDEGGVRLWDLAVAGDGAPREMRGGELPLGAAFSPGRTLLAVTGKGARLWELSSPGLAAVALHGGYWRFEAAFTPGSDWLVTSGIHTRNEAWPLTSSLPVLLERTAGQDLRGLEFTPDGRWLAVASHSGSELRRFPLDGDRIGEGETLFHEPGFGFQGLQRDDRGATLVSAVVDSTRGNGTVVRVSTADRSVRTWSRGSWNFVVDSDGRRVAARIPALDRSVLRVWDSLTGETVEFGSDESGVVGFTTDGRLLSRTLGALWAWNVPGKIRHKILDLDARDYAQLCPDRRTWVLHRGDGSLSFRSVDGTEVRRTDSDVPRDGLTSTAIDARCDLLVFGRSNGDVEVLRASTGERWSLPVHDGAVQAVSVDPQGRWIASAGRDGVKLWAIPKGPSYLDLSREAFLRRMCSLTNLRAVRDDRQPTGYAIRAEVPPDWAHPPRW